MNKNERKNILREIKTLLDRAGMYTDLAKKARNAGLYDKANEFINDSQQAIDEVNSLKERLFKSSNDN